MRLSQVALHPICAGQIVFRSPPFRKYNPDARVFKIAVHHAYRANVFAHIPVLQA